MRKTIAAAVICLGGSLAFAQATKPTSPTVARGDSRADLAPLKVKTGLWQMTETVTWTGLPPQLAMMMNGKPLPYKTCVKSENLNTNPWAEGSGEKCAWTVVSSTGTDMEVKGTSCDLGNQFSRMTAGIQGKIHVIDSENGTGSFAVTLTGNGQTMNGLASFTGKWIGPSCP
jgi:hypothetical protein